MINSKSYMKIIILHGDDVNKSYLRVTSFLNEAKKRNWEIIYDDIGRTPSIFGKEILYVVRDYKLLNKAPIFNGTLVIHHEGIIPVTFLNKFRGAKIEKYDLPKLIWAFLEKPSLKLFHELIKTEAVEYVFAMLGWKYKKRFMNSPTSDTVNIIQKLAQIDVDYKTGRADLESSLDLLIAKHLE